MKRLPGGKVTTAENVIGGASGSQREPALPRVDAFLEAKLHPPGVRAKWVRRDRLLLTLERSVTECPLTLIAAPAGYGKTTVVAQWLDRMTGRNVAWVALDAADNDPVRFWTHIATALERAGCAFSGGAASLVASHRAEIMNGLLPEIVVALAEAPSMILLALDDYHFIRSGACHEQVNFLIEHLPATRLGPHPHPGRSGLASGPPSRRGSARRDPSGSPVVRQRGGQGLAGGRRHRVVRGRPVRADEADRGLAGRALPDRDVIDRTGGSGCLRPRVQRRQPVHRGLPHRGGVDPEQSDDVRAFILESSIFERFSATLCEFVLQMPRAGHILHDLERSNLFLVPLDTSGRWFRFHHLFAAVARSELEAEDPARVTRLHERAADWFRANGFVDEAVGHAIAAGSTSSGLRLVQANWIRYVDAGRAATVDGWLSALRAPELEVRSGRAGDRGVDGRGSGRRGVPERAAACPRPRRGRGSAARRHALGRVGCGLDQGDGWLRRTARHGASRPAGERIRNRFPFALVRIRQLDPCSRALRGGRSRGQHDRAAESGLQRQLVRDDQAVRTGDHVHDRAGAGRGIAQSPLRDGGHRRGGGGLPAGRAPGLHGLDGVGREPSGRRRPRRARWTLWTRS